METQPYIRLLGHLATQLIHMQTNHAFLLGQLMFQVEVAMILQNKIHVAVVLFLINQSADRTY